MTIPPVAVELFHLYRRTDGHAHERTHTHTQDEANIRSSQFYERA